ncbi:MAG: prolyl oligopeptidase family serine peptidase, partial [Candidatus Zixiibacteriota bacterium]
AWPNAVNSPDGRWLFVSNYHGYLQEQIYYRDERKRDFGLRPLLTDSAYLYDIIPLNDRFFIRTNEGAGRFRVMSATYDHPEREYWKEVVPESRGTINSVLAIGNRLIVNRLENAYSHITLYAFDGSSPQELALPTLGTAESFAGEWSGHELFFYFSSYTVPPSLLRYDLTTNQLTEMDRMKLNYSFTDFETKQVWFNSKDGTPVSMFIVAPKGTKLDGTNPVLLNGYGGFRSSDTPIFSRKTAVWLLHGGIYVDVNLRGGGEYGDAWHKAGILEKKQNVFDDFIAAAEYLIKEKYTSTEKLAIYGGSNGGLLIGAVITQRPDLYAAAVCDVPLLDMIRYDRFQLAKLWNSEYGSADDSTQFAFLYKYSPYHNVHKGTKYPAVLFKAGESDSRVDPMHARKMAALMQASTGSDKPIFLRVDSKSGHGQGKPTAKVAEEIVDEYCFLFQALGLRL